MEQEVDIADLIAGELLCSRADAYELMHNALSKVEQAVEQPTRGQLLEALAKIKLRIAFMGWPAESMWNVGTDVQPRWVPDWRYESQLIEHLLNGAEITASEKPTDTKPANEIHHPQVAEVNTKVVNDTEPVALQPLTEWRPIETAPKDGTEVMVFSPDVDHMVSFYQAGLWREKANMLGMRKEPTHWMPLPDAPDTTNSTGE